MRSKSAKTQTRLIWALALVLVARAGPAIAQTRQQPQIKPPSATGGEPVTTPTILVSPDEDYRIGPRDVIEVRIDDAPELSSPNISVNADGTFLMPYLMRMKAEGKTPDQLAKEIADGLRGRYLKNPNVMVNVKQFYSRSFFILGAVRKPGVYQIEGKPSLLKLLTIAGGPAENHGSTALIMREIKKKQAAGEGETRVRQVAATAQNPTPQPADLKTESADEPDYETQVVNINGLFRGITSGPQIHLEPGDIVNIPVADVFYVAGEVNQPGQFQLSEGTTLRQAMALAQGTTFNAASGDGVIFRTDPATGRREEIKVNIGQVMKNQKPDMVLLANDIVMVPNSKSKTIGNAFLKALGMGAAQRGPTRY